MNIKPNWKSTRIVILAAAPVAAALWAPRAATAATYTWSGAHSNFIGTTSTTASSSNWTSPNTAAGSNSSLTNNDLAVLPDSLSGANYTNPEPIYIATTSNQNTTYSIGAFQLTDASPADVSQYGITNNNTGGSTVQLYLNGTMVNGVANTILSDTTTVTPTILEVGSDLGTKPTSLPLAVTLGNTTNNVYAASGDQVVVTSNISESTAPSSINMSGGGTLQLSGANTFTGGVTVNSSTFSAGFTGGASSSQSSTGTSASNVTLNSSTLASAPAVTSYIGGNVLLGTGSNIIAPGSNGTTNSVGTLDVAGSLALSGSTTFDLDLAGGSGDQLNVGTLLVSGTPTINIDNVNGPSGNFVVATYGTNNSLSNSSFNFTNTPNGYTWIVTSTEIELMQQQLPASVTWNVTPASGSVSGTWDATSGNWAGGSPVANRYKSGDTANFNEISGGTSGLITIATGGVTPFNTIITNTNTSYSFTDQDGTYGIGGAGALTKNGTGTVTLEAANSYSGGTFINGGTLIADGDSTLGGSVDPIVFAGGTLEAGTAIGSTATPSSRAITVNTGGGTFNTNGLSSVDSGTVTVGDVFHVTGSGGLELDGPVTFNANGALNIDSPTATVTFGGTANSDTITQMNSSTYNGKLVVTNTARINFNTASTDSSTAVFDGTGEIDITNPGTTQVVTIPVSGSPSIVYTTYDTGVTITNLKSTAGVSTAGGIVNLPIKLNSTNLSFTKADVTQPDATFVPGNFTVTIGGTTAGDGLTLNGVISGNSDVNIANGPAGGGAGSLTLGAANTYTGTTLINGSGTLQLAVADALPISTDVIFATISGGVGATTTVDLDGNLQEWNSLSSGQFRHQGDENITNYSNNPAILEINGSATPADPFDGVISDGNGFVSLLKEGTNTLHLTGTSTFSGGTTLNGGTISTSDDTGLGAPFSTLTFGGGTLAVTGSLTSPYLSSRYITVNPGGGTIDVSPTTTYTLTDSGLNYNGGTLTFADSGAATLTQSGGTIAVAPGSTLAVAATANLSVNGTTDPFTDNTGSPTPNHVAIVNNGILSVAQVNSTVASINGSGTLTVGDGVNQNTLQIAQNHGTSNSMASLNILGNSSLDITNNAIFINYGSGPDPISSIATLIQSGFNGGAWNGIGINSSLAALNSRSYGIGYADSQDFNNPAGLASDQIEIKYTLLGDANLDGKVNGTDFTLMATNFNDSVTNGWDKGDFDYSNTVNGSDFLLLANNFNQFASQSAVTASDLLALDQFAAANGISLDSVPEPASLGLLAAGTIGLLGRRRRRQ